MLKIDHVVHFLKNDDLVKTAFTPYGLNVTEGGKHENWGSKNSLYYADLTYIEWLSIENYRTASNTDNPLIKQYMHDIQNGDGFGQLCFRTNDLTSIRIELDNAGLSSTVFNGERRRQDGTLLQWKMLFINEDVNFNLMFPFIIEWQEDDEERLQNLKFSDAIKEDNHKLKSIYYLVENAHQAKEKFSIFLKDTTFESFTMDNFSLDGLCSQIYDTKLFFCETVNPQLLSLLKTRGERPFMVELTGFEKNKFLTEFGSFYHLSN